MKDKRIELSTPDNAHFMSVWSALSTELGEKLIEFHKSHSCLHKAGSVGTGEIDEQIKKSADMSIEPVDLEKPARPSFGRRNGPMRTGAARPFPVRNTS
jgi:hypothetical protein